MALNTNFNPEQLLLAWVFLKPKQADEIFSRVQPTHFATAVNAEAFEKAREIHAKGQTPDPFSVAQLMTSGEAFNYLLSLCNIPLMQNLDAVIDSVKDLGARTRLRIALESSIRSLDEHTTFQDAYTAAKTALDNLTDTQQDEEGPRLVKDMLPDYVAELQRRSMTADGELMGLSTGFPSLDRILNGLKPGNMIVVAGRPSMGKSTFALNIAHHNAKAGKSVVVFSMEMFEGDLNDKFVSADSGVFLDRLQSGEAVGDERAMTSVTKAIKALHGAKLWMETKGALTVDQVRSGSFRIKRKHGLDLVVIDYLGLMRGEGKGRYEQVTAISNGLQRLSRDLGIPVIVLSQLSRNLESRPDKRPVMSDLRESGAIEQDADVILFPYRDAYYNPSTPYKSDDREISEIIVAKNKMGQRGATAYLVWQGNMSRFIEDTSGTDWKALQNPIAEETGRTKRRIKGMFNA